MIVDPEGPLLEGISVTLLCRSRGNPPVTNYTWYKHDKEDKEPGSVLVIESVDLSHSGDYHCTAANELGEDNSEAIQLDIQCKFILHSSHWFTLINQLYVSRAEYGSTVYPAVEKQDLEAKSQSKGNIAMSGLWTVTHCCVVWQPRNSACERSFLTELCCTLTCERVNLCVDVLFGFCPYLHKKKKMCYFSL